MPETRFAMGSHMVQENAALKLILCKVYGAAGRPWTKYSNGSK